MKNLYIPLIIVLASIVCILILPIIIKHNDTGVETKTRINHITKKPVVEIYSWHKMEIVSHEEIQESEDVDKLTRHEILKSSWFVPLMTDSIVSTFQGRAQRALDHHIKYCNK